MLKLKLNYNKMTRNGFFLEDYIEIKKSIY